MANRQKSNRPVQNLILMSLPTSEFDRLFPNLKLVNLTQSRVIYHPGESIREVYFPNTGMVSVLSTTSEAETIEIAMVGNEGMVGMPIFWGSETTPYRMTVQIAGAAYVMSAALLKEELKHQTALRDLLLRHTYTLIKQIAQSAICNRFHTIEQRLCRWLLTTHDRTKANGFNLTQVALSQMLGSARQRLNGAVHSLQKKELIRYMRGQILILDRSGLEMASCECYGVVKRGFEKTVYDQKIMP
ncbi:MAG TPA: Crp/Fnr family transcriptional regulator [Blastocatellia bacterium]|nr:Crp/Fnr family transcriptional regulator [Blastocatellia bacterium]